MDKLGYQDTRMVVKVASEEKKGQSKEYGWENQELVYTGPHYLKDLVDAHKAQNELIAEAKESIRSLQGDIKEAKCNQNITRHKMISELIQNGDYDFLTLDTKMLGI